MGTSINACGIIIEDTTAIYMLQIIKQYDVTILS